MTDYIIRENSYCHSAKLEAIVKHHAQTEFAKPIGFIQHEAFKQACSLFDEHDKPIVLDSGCGTGLSTVMLAQKHKDSFVLGLDRSRHRLDKFQDLKDNLGITNCAVLQVNLEDFWRLIKASNYKISHHYLFYPNPYPKFCDLKKRWYAHPLFSTVMGLSTYLEVRSNWRLYAEEWKIAASVLGYSSEVEDYYSDTPITRFEDKYWKAQCPTYRLRF